MVQFNELKHDEQRKEKSRCKYSNLSEYPFNARLDILPFPRIQRLIDQVHGRMFHGIFHGTTEKIRQYYQ